jgi:hypothetical protein
MGCVSKETLVKKTIGQETTWPRPASKFLIARCGLCNIARSGFRPCEKSKKIASFHTGIHLAFLLIGLSRRSAVRRLLNRCGDRELLLALMALVGSIVALVIV